jgi:hypothetical protein
MRYLAIAGAIIAVVIGYTLVWTHLADRVRDEATRWVEERRLAGQQISYGGLRVGGYPYRLSLEIEAPAIGEPNSPLAWEWRGDRLVAHTQPWKLRHLIFELHGAQQLSWRDEAGQHGAVGEADSARASLAFDRDGRWLRGAVEIKGLAVDAESGPVTANRIELHARPAADPARAGGVDVAVEAAALVLPAALVRPLGQNVGRFRAVATVSGPLPARLDAAAVGAWRDAGGVVDIERIEFDQDGVTVRGNGTFTLDQEMRPLAALSAEIAGYDRLIGAMVSAGRVSPRDAQTARIALGLLAKNGADGRPYVSAPVTAQNGRLYLGPLALAALPPLLPAPTTPPPADRNSPR